LVNYLPYGSIFRFTFTIFLAIFVKVLLPKPGKYAKRTHEGLKAFHKKYIKIKKLNQLE